MRKTHEQLNSAMISSTYVGVAGLTNPSPSCCLLDRALPGEEEQSSVCAHKQTVTQTASWEGRLTAHDSLVCEDEVEVGFLFVSVFFCLSSSSFCWASASCRWESSRNANPSTHTSTNCAPCLCVKYAGVWRCRGVCGVCVWGVCVGRGRCRGEFVL